MTITLRDIAIQATEAFSVLSVRLIMSEIVISSALNVQINGRMWSSL